jgi:hypothetical protein
MDHSISMPGPAPINSAEAGVNEACVACRATRHIYMTLNHIEVRENEYKEDIPIDIFMDSRSAVDVIITVLSKMTRIQYTSIPDYIL